MRMPPSELERLHRAQREVLQESSDYWETVAYLRSELPLISPAGYERPITGSLQGTSERQQIPVAPGSADLLVAEHEYVMAHVEAALQLEHPMARASVRAVPDLRDAVAWVAHNTEHDPALQSSTSGNAGKAFCRKLAECSRPPRTASKL